MAEVSTAFSDLPEMPQDAQRNAAAPRIAMRLAPIGLNADDVADFRKSERDFLRKAAATQRRIDLICGNHHVYALLPTAAQIWALSKSWTFVRAA